MHGLHEASWRQLLLYSPFMVMGFVVQCDGDGGAAPLVHHIMTAIRSASKPVQRVWYPVECSHKETDMLALTAVHFTFRPAFCTSCSVFFHENVRKIIHFLHLKCLACLLFPATPIIIKNLTWEIYPPVQWV